MSIERNERNERTERRKEELKFDLLNCSGGATRRVGAGRLDSEPSAPGTGGKETLV